jgi:hypothetical protein
MTFHAVFPTITTQKAVFSLPEQTFDFLEKPEYYFDGFHLNAKGRQRFTETLAAELVGRLRSANSDGRVRSESSLAADPFPLGSGTLNISRSSDDGLSGRRIDEAN